MIALLKRPVFWILLLLGASLLAVLEAINVMNRAAHAYLYGYPLVLMDRTRQHALKSGGRLNHVMHSRIFPDHEFRAVIRPNVDTLYSIAWFDLGDEPMVISVPESGDRYYVLPFMDAWTNVFDMIGQRKTGNAAGSYLLAGPDWQGQPPVDLQLIRAPTSMVWMIGRVQVDGEDDLPAVFQLQDSIEVTPLSRWPLGPPNDSTVISAAGSRSDGSTNVAAEVEAMGSIEFFGRLASLLGEQPPASADGELLAILRDLGIVAGESLQAGPVRRWLYDKAVAKTRAKMLQQRLDLEGLYHGWHALREHIGVYGTHYPERAMVARFGLGALPAQEAAYPRAHRDRMQRPLSGEFRYRIHFDADRLPPAAAFWSLTVYNDQGYLVDNPIGRYALGDRSDLEYNADGSLDIFVQHDPAQPASNWLPAPRGPFSMILRLYLPGEEYVSGQWKVPGLLRQE